MASLRALSTYRPQTLTRLSLPEAGSVLGGLVRERFPALSPHRSLIAAAILLAQASLETASFDACWNHNWANVRTPKGSVTVPFFLNAGKVDEIIGGKRVVAQGPEDPLRIFAAFDSPEEGARRWVRQLERWPDAVAALQEGDDELAALERFGRALGAPGTHGGKFYLADPDRYCATLRERWPVCWAAVAGEPLLPPLRRGDREEDDQGPLHEWQRFLVRSGAKVTITPDGLFGPGTEAATKAWQRAHGLRDDGVVGAVTRLAAGLPYVARGEA